MLRKYSCNKHPNYSIRNHYFVNGQFETDNPDVQRLIEGCDGFGVFIHHVETPEELAAMKEIEKKAAVVEQPEEKAVDENAVVEPPDEANEEAPPIATQGARGTGSNKGTRKGQTIGAKRG